MLHFATTAKPYVAQLQIRLTVLCRHTCTLVWFTWDAWLRAAPEGAVGSKKPIVSRGRIYKNNYSQLTKSRASQERWDSNPNPSGKPLPQPIDVTVNVSTSSLFIHQSDTALFWVKSTIAPDRRTSCNPEPMNHRELKVHLLRLSMAAETRVTSSHLTARKQKHRIVSVQPHPDASAVTRRRVEEQLLETN